MADGKFCSPKIQNKYLKDTNAEDIGVFMMVTDYNAILELH